MKLKKKHIPLIAGALAAIAAAGMYHSELSGLLEQLGDREQVVSLLTGYDSAGPVILSVLLLLQVFLAWIPGHALMVGGGLLYGFPVAFGITASMTILGSQLAFLLARRSGRPFVERFVSQKLLIKWENASERQGVLFYLMTFWLPIFPSDMMCFMAGLGNISSRRFFVANFFGRLPCAALLVLLGSQQFTLPSYAWVGLVGAAALSLAVWKLLGVRQTRPLALSN